MAVTFVKRSLLPAPVKGKVGSMSVTITANGQVQLSKMASDFIHTDHLVIGFDGAKVFLFKTDAKLVAKVDPKDYQKLNTPKKGAGGKSFSGTAVLSHATEYGASHLYPYKASGNQTFPVVADEKNGCLTFELPASALTPKPVVKRVKKAPVSAGTAAQTSQVEGVPVNQEGELELVIDAA